MPQANITYDTAYNRRLVSRIKEMEGDMLWQNNHQYHPSPMGYRLSSFHDPQGIGNTPNIGRSGKMTGGNASRKFVLNGDSTASSIVPSGVSRAIAGVDGASGGNFYKDFKKGFDGVMDSSKKVASTIATIAPVAALATKALSGSSRPRGRPAKKHVAKPKLQTGGNFFKALLSLAKKIAPPALSLLTGLGRKANMTDKKKAITDAIVGGNFWDSFKKGFTDVAKLASKVAPMVLPLMTGLGKKQYGGSFNFGKFLEKVGKAAAPVAIKEGKKALGLGRKTKPVGGNILEDAIEATKPILRKGKSAVVEAIKENAPKVTALLTKEAEKAVKKSVGGGGNGRAARAAIVKKVMAEKGMKMIAASKYVKEHGLYKK
tara:strand:+ start:3825 stop:4946 length:1122 start_codon:yes stop_codon:yes gene_type:complete